ncbi:hypothetical protein WJX79_005485 [Trebouxia sp. C0005]
MWHGTWSACPPASRPLFASLSPRRVKHATFGTSSLVEECSTENWNKPMKAQGLSGSVFVALGKFDGMHQGHRLLAQQAASSGASPYLLSFSGMAETLVAKLKVSGIVVGQNYRFGYKAAGDSKLLQALGESHGIKVDVVNLVEAGTVPDGLQDNVLRIPMNLLCNQPPKYGEYQATISMADAMSEGSKLNCSQHGTVLVKDDGVHLCRELGAWATHNITDKHHYLALDFEEPH